MQFITYFELNEDMAESERQAVVGKIMEKGLFPPEGVNVIRWDSTPDLWGVVIFEADTVEQSIQAIGTWRAAGAGFFKLTKTSPMMPVQELVPIMGGVLEKLNG